MFGLALTQPAVASMGGGPSLAEQIVGIFADATPGYWINTRDYPRMYQDRFSLANPCTGTVGELVGQILDMSRGLAEGPELRGNCVVHMRGTATPATYDTGTGNAVVYFVDDANRSAITLSSVIAANSYQISITNTGTEIIRVRQANNSSVLQNISVGQSLLLMVSGFTDYFFNVSTGTTGTFTINSINHIAGNHYRAPADAARPVLAVGYNGVVAPVSDGIDDVLTGPTISYPNNFLSMMAVASKTAATSNRTILNFAGTDVTRMDWPRATGTNRAAGILGSAENRGPITPDVHHALIEVYLNRDGATVADQVTGAYNGVAFASTSGSVTTSGAFGNRTPGLFTADTRWHDSFIYGAVAMNRAWTDAEKNTIRAYLHEIVNGGLI
jgi:hypothetical protein